MNNLILPWPFKLYKNSNSLKRNIFFPGWYLWLFVNLEVGLFTLKSSRFFSFFISEFFLTGKLFQNFSQDSSQSSTGLFGRFFGSAKPEPEPKPETESEPTPRTIRYGSKWYVKKKYIIASWFLCIIIVNYLLLLLFLQYGMFALERFTSKECF